MVTVHHSEETGVDMAVQTYVSWLITLVITDWYRLYQKKDGCRFFCGSL